MRRHVSQETGCLARGKGQGVVSKTSNMDEIT